MKIVIASDSYKESLSAAEVARAIEAGFREVFPEARFQCLPVADGGEGTVDAMVAATGGRRVAQRVTGPLGQPVEAFYGLTGRDVTIAQVSGNLYLYDAGIATTANGYPFASAEKLNLCPTGDYFTLISDSSAATAKIIVWK